MPGHPERWPAKLDAMLENHPEFAYGFLYDKKTNTFVGRTQPSRQDDPQLRAEGEKWFEMAQAWLPQDSKEVVENLRWYEEMDGTPFFSFYSNKVKRNGKLLYQFMVFFLPPELEKGRVALAGLAIDPAYLHDEFLPRALEAVLTGEKDGSGSKNPPVMMIHMKKESEPIVASARWDGGKPEVERNFEDVFPGMVLAKCGGATLMVGTPTNPDRLGVSAAAAWIRPLECANRGAALVPRGGQRLTSA